MNLPLQVVCAVIQNSAGEILACQRSASTSHPGKWEFPGGKVEPDESPEAAIKREIVEELGVNITIIKSLTTVNHNYPDFAIALQPFLCSLTETETPTALEHAQIKWISPSEATDLDWAAADIFVLSQCNI